MGKGHAAGRQAFRPERILALGFLSLIALGTGLLAMPFAGADGESAGLFDSLFTAASAVCVTGLTVRDTGMGWSRAGQTILLVLMQLGGLGFMISATLAMVALGRRITLRGRILLRESMNESGLSGLVRLTMIYGGIALSLELLGAALLSIRFIPMLGLGEGLYYSFFHAVSAFCNAGFDLMGEYRSLADFSGDPLVLLPVSLLIILGGLGFSVMVECLRNRFRWGPLSLHGKLVLLSTGLLLLAGGCFFTLAEWRNPATLGAFPPGIRIMNGLFQGAALRTAGFDSISQQALRDGSKLFSILLMFIGASPASTGGGVKTTTVSVLILLVGSVIGGQQEIQWMGRRLARDLVRRAIAVFFISMALLLGAALIISFLEEGRFPFLDLLFECASALGTVGVSSIGTANLSPAGRALLIPLMFFGRLGPMTLAMALARRRGMGEETIRYPEESVMIG